MIGKRSVSGWAFVKPLHPTLIKDFQAYNAISQGGHWVGDLAVECTLESKSDSGLIVLDLVDGGQQHFCSIDLGRRYGKRW